MSMYKTNFAEKHNYFKVLVSNSLQGHYKNYCSLAFTTI